MTNKEILVTGSKILVILTTPLLFRDGDPHFVGSKSCAPPNLCSYLWALSRSICSDARRRRSAVVAVSRFALGDLAASRSIYAEGNCRVTRATTEAVARGATTETTFFRRAKSSGLNYRAPLPSSPRWLCPLHRRAHQFLPSLPPPAANFPTSKSALAPQS